MKRAIRQERHAFDKVVNLSIVPRKRGPRLGSPGAKARGLARADVKAGTISKTRKTRSWFQAQCPSSRSRDRLRRWPMDLNFIRREIERMRRQMLRQRKEIQASNAPIFRPRPRKG